MEGLTIYLGSRCNLNCAYCHREPAEHEGTVSDTLIDYVRGRSDVRIKFMGGEPTLFMEEIKKVVAAAPAAKYAVSTNGVGLRQYLEFFRKHKFLICISYDGAENSLRGFDPFTELIDYPWLAVSCTLYHGNTDFQKIIKNFAAKERIIGRGLSFFPHIVHHTSADNAAYALTAADFDNILQQYKECIVNFVSGYKVGVVNRRYAGLYTKLVRAYRAQYEYGETYCVNRRLQKLDAAGKHYSCLYIRNEELLAAQWQKQQAEFITEKFPDCQNCTVYKMCGGACIKSLNHKLECSFYKRLYNWFAYMYEKNRMLLDTLEVR